MSTSLASIENILQNLNIETLNEMQVQALQTVEKDTNTVLMAPTGSGKTLGFLLPLVKLLDPAKSGIQALILVPSRELAIQIEQVFKAMGTGYKVNCCYGGHDVQIEKNNLSQPPAVLIGTPGRIADHLTNGRIETTGIRTLVLDEYDKCVEMGFIDEISNIVRQLRHVSKRMLTSATAPIEGYKLPGFTNPAIIDFSIKNTPNNLTVKVVSTTEQERLDTLFRLVCKIGKNPMLIFCNQRDTVEEISTRLADQKLANNVFHGGLDQGIRERTLIKFRNGTHRILVTTDLASRGLDIPDIEHIIHYNLPETETIFTHRNGRTARMNASGTAYLIVSEQEKVPAFFKDKPDYEKLPVKVAIPQPTQWVTLYIAAGKKEKISKGDIAGLLMQKGQLQKDDLGLIDILDHTSYVAVKRDKIEALLKLVHNAPIKKQKVKMEVAR